MQEFNVGDRVLIVYGYSDSIINARVDRLTNTQIIVVANGAERRFRKSDGHLVGGSGSGWSLPPMVLRADSDKAIELIGKAHIRHLQSKIRTAYESWRHEMDDVEKLQDLVDATELLKKTIS